MYKRQPYSRVKIAFRTKRSNVDRVFLVCKGQKNLMFKASSDAQFDYYEVKLQLDNEKISWYFEIQAGAITCYYDFRGVVTVSYTHLDVYKRQYNVE